MKKTNQKINFLSTILSKGWESCRGYSLKDSGSGAGMTAESGRSMVEMLGVLAIVGVISIGAVSGYNYGMNRYRTNEVLDGGNKRAYTISTQDSLGIPYNLSEFKDSDVTGGGTFASTVQDWDGEFGLTVTKVTKPVCENLIRMIGDRTTLRAITKSSDEKTDLAIGDCADGENSLFLVYNKDMLAAEGGNSSRQDNSSGTSSTGGESSSTSSSASPSTTSSAFDESQTFVAGASGRWNVLNSAPNHGCPDGYTWASKAAAESYASDIVNGTKCATCPGEDLWTSTVYENDSSTVWYLDYGGNFYRATRSYVAPALCVVD